MIHIPKKIHITWKHKNILNVKSKFLDKCIHNVVKLAPEWKVEVFDDDLLDSYLKKYLDKFDYLRIKDKHPVEKSDTWRLIKLYVEGGLYIDIDKMCNTSINDIIKEDTKFVLPTCMDYDFSHDFMCSAPENPIYLCTLELNLKRRAEGIESVYVLGPQTYMNGATLSLFGTMFNPNPGKEIFESMRNELNKLGYAVTYRENPPNETILCVPKSDDEPFDHEAEKRNFYSSQGLRHWTNEW
jgi:hypothetical protein